MSDDAGQTPFAVLIAEYERLRRNLSTDLMVGDEDAHDAAYERAEKQRELIFALTPRTRENAAAKARFIAAWARELEGDISRSGAIDAIEDLARFLEG